ncbi:MAG: DNA mismatch repair protein MutS [Deltaproteobacteria bacterium]|nr:DNA mismatch repair protein MutS [Deltaproteobacteria bacterium]
MTRSALDTPMMRQYLALKARHPDALLFYRMGDFYELFLADAERAAPLLDITLTTRDKGKPDAVPMCGVPVHGVDPYLKRLAELGLRVAICEQVEDPRATGGRRLVRREVVEVVTPGLLGDPEGLDAAREVALAALALGAPGEEAGLAALEASTGEFRATATAADTTGLAPGPLVEELRRIAPRELLLAAPIEATLAASLGAALPGVVLTPVDPASFAPREAPAHPDGFDPQAADAATRAAAAVLAYLGALQPFALRHAAVLRRYALGDAMVLDAATRTHLELFTSAEDGSRRGTLVERLDATLTPMGARRLARWLGYPLLDPAAIGARQDAVAWLAERDRRRAAIRERLRPVRDLERGLAKAARPSATPRDLAALRASLAALPALAEAFAPGGDDWLPGAEGAPPPALPRPRPVEAAWRLLEDALVDEPPVLLRGSRGAGETGFVRDGYRPELDALRDAARKGREWIAGLEARERERTGVASLKVRFHPVHGYGLEVTKSNLGRVPGDYERKQTLAGAERFTTPELREMEARVLGAHERAAALERELFEEVRAELLEHGAAIRAAAEAVAALDALQSLAEVARRDGWVRPVVDGGERLEIHAGRHPVVEAMRASRTGEAFVPNDTCLDPADARILLLTGPNMSGKSTYLRQVALIALLAQVGSFVPAESARIGVVDRIFTRVGASDRLARGESTFLVEMRETAEILAQATRRSLVILDEIGRGTSTFDGLSIAWAVAEHLHDAPGLRCRTLFATHYHELVELAASRPQLRNAHFEVREWGHDVVFLRRLVPGGASRSYGIQVARLAGLPDTVIARAREVLATLEAHAADPVAAPATPRARPAPAAPQLPLFEPSEPPLRPGERSVLEELRGLVLDRTAPLDALLLLQRWRERLGGGGRG